MKILIIEDDKQMATTIRDGLKKQYVVDMANNGKKAEVLFSENEYDIILLDLNLPDIDGIELCKKIRDKNTVVPILAVTGRTSIDDKIKTLDFGADDYINKPFNFEELLARIRCLLRRRSNVPIVDGQLNIDDLSLDINSKEVKRDGKLIDLRQKEFQLLEYLIQNKGIVINRDKILQHVWKTSTDPFTNTVDVHIQSLRNKIDKPFEKPLIKTVYGFGYVLKSDAL
jgi:two-component system, OmpR family, copper resistance phosphate regulon response regulator CusR